MSDLIRVDNISTINEVIGLKPPKHPLICVYNDRDGNIPPEMEGRKVVMDLYLILFKDKANGSLGYGRNSYDFQEGTLVFIGPGQVMEFPSMELMKRSNGWSLMFHPDLIRKSHLGTFIDEYSFFSYEVNEALHLSNDEQEHIFEVVSQIRKEYSQNLDRHSQRLIISNLELLLNYCTRFYDRQFLTRTNFNKDFVSGFNRLLKDYFQTKKSSELGIPTVSYFGEVMNMSPNYLSDLIKKETGQGIKAHINNALIERAKTALLNSDISVSQIAYELGFEYPQSLSRLFKSKTGMAPHEYRLLN
ncbi:MAG: helix-turn-helix transcriptional regulator [Bacteroidia bacterium]|nr:helix-turn-helix transcriptional regulator [Bacteroidia bacterium]